MVCQWLLRGAVGLESLQSAQAWLLPHACFANCTIVELWSHLPGPILKA